MNERKIDGLEEISRRPGWFDLAKDGGGDIDLVDYQETPPKPPLDYDHLP